MNFQHVVDVNNPTIFTLLNLICSDSLEKYVKLQDEVERENLTHIFEV